MNKTRFRYAKDFSGISFSIIVRWNFTIMSYIQADELVEYGADSKGKKTGRKEWLWYEAASKVWQTECIVILQFEKRYLHL